MSASIDISPEKLAIVQGILKAHLPKGTLAWAFGSRVTWAAKPFSDLDIALEGAEPLPSDVLIDLEEAFDSSDLPWKVDVIDLNAVSPEFRAIVEAQRVPADWRETVLGELVNFRNGVNFAREDEGEGIPILKVKNFRALHHVPTESLDELDLNRISIPKTQLLQKGDIVIIRSNGNRELVGRSLIFGGHSRPVTFSGFCIRARALSVTTSPEFIHYWLRSPQTRARFTREGNGTGINNLSQGFLGKLPIEIPASTEQEAIVQTLSALDDKIELNRRMNETLEAMARAVFRDWFVDFGPTRRKAAGITDPAAILGGLLLDPSQAAHLAALFPDRFGDNDLPEGWEVKTLDEIAEFLNGLALQKFPAKAGEDSMPVIKIAELRGGVTAKSNRASRDLPQKYVINDGDFIFSWSGSLMAKFWTDGEGALNQHLFKVSSEAYPAWFYSQWVYHHLDEFQRIAASKATTMGHIQRGHLKAAMTVDPGEAMLNATGGIMGPLLELAIHNDLENQTLAATRDLLLPKLMSGELRIKGMEGVE